MQVVLGALLVLVAEESPIGESTESRTLIFLGRNDSVAGLLVKQE